MTQKKISILLLCPWLLPTLPTGSGCIFASSIRGHNIMQTYLTKGSREAQIHNAVKCSSFFFSYAISLNPTISAKKMLTKNSSNFFQLPQFSFRAAVWQMSVTATKVGFIRALQHGDKGDVAHTVHTFMNTL